METNFITIITFLYAIGGAVSLIGYVPTIIDLWKKHPSANVHTYLIWCVTLFTTSLYGFFVLQNLIFNVFVNLQLFACLIILILRIRLKFVK